MHLLISQNEAFDRFKSWYVGLSGELKEKITRFVLKNRPNHIKLSSLIESDGDFQKFDLDLAQGQIAEQALKRLLAGRIEVKTDYKTWQTGNVAVEFVCSGKPSGISTSESDWWAFVLAGEYKEEVVIVIKKERLLDKLRGCRVVRGGDNNRAEMYLLPVEKLVK